jgi:hypothetical protein
MFVVSNSREDMEMMLESVEMTMIVSPHDKKVRNGEDGPMAGETVRSLPLPERRIGRC